MIDFITKNAVVLGVFILLYTAECLFPYFEDFNETKKTHDIQNLLLIAFNTIVVNLLLVPVTVIALTQNIGLFHIYQINPYLQFFLTLLVLDLLYYLAHVLFHKIPILWRFHMMHHSDTQMDSTTGARFHIGEHTLSILARSVLYVAMGMSATHVAITETIFLANVIFHHANITISEKFDRIYRLVFTSPNMHKVHHSNKVEEADTNYTAIFSFWDRLFGTYKIVENPEDIVYGVKGLEDDQTFSKMIMTPLSKETGRN